MKRTLAAILTFALASTAALACPGDGYKAKGAKPEASQPASPKPGST